MFKQSSNLRDPFYSQHHLFISVPKLPFGLNFKFLFHFNNTRLFQPFKFGPRL